MVGGLPKFALTFSRDFVAMFAKVITEEFVGDLEGGFVLFREGGLFKFEGKFGGFLCGFELGFKKFFVLKGSVGNSGGGGHFFNKVINIFRGIGVSDGVCHRSNRKRGVSQEGV